MGFSYSLPVSGQPHSTEDPKVTTALTTLSTWGNGQVLDTDLNSPNNSVRRLLLQASGNLGSPGTGSTAGTWLSSGSSFQSQSGVPLAGGLCVVWAGDAGYSSQPQDFQVANKTATARLRANIIPNAVAPGINFTCGFFPISGAGGTGGAITITLGASLASVVFTAPTASTFVGAESAAFTLPTSALGYTLACTTSGSMTANSNVLVSMQLLGYNA